MDGVSQSNEGNKLVNVNNSQEKKQNKFIQLSMKFLRLETKPVLSIVK